MLIQTTTAANQPGLASLDRTFLVESQLAIQVRDGVLTYEVVPVREPYWKSYPPPAASAPDLGTVFVAQEGSAVVGLLAASRHWSGIVEIDDLAVSSAARRQGVGRALVEAAKGFVVERGFPGIRVETQSNNVGACMLYARAGFCLAGFDTLLYCSTKGVENEVALFWYWRCP